MMQEEKSQKETHIEVQDLTMAYGDFVVMRDLNFTIGKGEVFIIMGGSGCGKSTLLRHLIGLMPPAKGKVLYEGESFWDADPQERDRMMKRFGVLYQSGALWSSMTLAENVAIPLEEYTDLSSSQIKELVSLKLSLMALAGFEEFYPSEISGLDPVSARRLDDLILELRDSLGTTVVVVTHELASIFAIGDNSVFLDPDTRTMLATGNPKTLLAESKDPKIQSFLTRGEQS